MFLSDEHDDLLYLFSRSSVAGFNVLIWNGALLTIPMTKDEKSDPDLINASRVKRIARGSGWPEHEVKELLKAYKNSKTMMKASKGRQMQGMLRKMGLG